MAAANRYTTTELIAGMRRTGHIPASQNAFQDADLLALADYELQTGIMRQVLSVRENYWLTSVDLAIAQDSIYNIPVRAIGSALSYVHILNGTVMYNVVRSEIQEQFSTVTSPSGYFQYYLRGNQLVLIPNPTTGVIRLWHYQRPNTLIVPSAAAQITAIDTNTNIVTCSSIPSTFATSTPLDLIRDQAGFDCLAIDQTPTAVSGSDVTFSSLPTGLAVGDWIALAGQTPVPQIPVEFRPLLIQRVVVKYNEIQGYMDKMKASEAKLEQMEKDCFEAINPRVKEDPKRIVPDSGLIGGYRRWRAWRAT